MFLSQLIHISLSPNTKGSDIFLALKLLFQPFCWKQGNAQRKLEQEFKDYLGIRYAFSFNSGRSAFMAILYALAIGNDDNVAIQAFTCNAVPNPILWAGAEPVYVDIDDTLNIDPYDLEQKITPRSKAVIIQHTFGTPAQIDRIIEIAKRHNLFVIEDCAHSLGAFYRGKKVGTLGDAAFFSFGRDKVISSVYGGMAVANNADVAKRLKEFWQKCEYPSSFWVLQQLLHPIIFSIALPLYNVMGIGRMIIKICQIGGFVSLAVAPEEKDGNKPTYFPRRLPEALAVLALHQFQKLGRFNQHRRRIAEFYRRHLALTTYRNPITISGVKPVFLRYSILSSRRDKILREMKKRGTYLGDWYTSVIAPHDTNLGAMHYISGSCPKAEKTAREIFNLPTHINISIKNAQKIINILNEYQGNQ